MKMVFGEYREVTETRRIKCKNVRIHGGEVPVKFRGKWHNVEENHPKGTDYLRDITKELAEKAGKPYCSILAAVVFS